MSALSALLIAVAEGRVVEVDGVLPVHRFLRPVLVRYFHGLHCPLIDPIATALTAV
jgi:hypothetical protein